MITEAAKCSPIINAYQGYSYDSRRPEGKQSHLDEARNRMSIKSQYWVGESLNPSFYFLMMEGAWEFEQTLRPEHRRVDFTGQDHYCTTMGL